MAPPQSTSIPKKNLSPRQAIIVGEHDKLAAFLAKTAIVRAVRPGVLLLDELEREFARPACSSEGEWRLAAIVHDDESQNSRAEGLDWKAGADGIKVIFGLPLLPPKYDSRT